MRSLGKVFRLIRTDTLEGAISLLLLDICKQVAIVEREGSQL